MTLKPLAAATGLAALMLATPAPAGEAGDILREALYSGEYLDVLGELVPRAEAGDQEARFGVGFVRFVRGVESFAQMLYFHGLAAPETGPMGPALALPVPINPDPTPLDYNTVRGILEAVVFNFDVAGEDLIKAGEGDYVVLIDPLKVRIDVNGDGASEDTETIGQVLSRAFGMTRPEVTPVPVDPPATTVPGRGGRGQGSRPAPSASTPPATLDVDSTIGFDRADAVWLAGYGEVLAAQADFLLAHDFSMFVNSTFHRLFPKAGLPMQEYAEGGMLVLDPATDTAIADAIAGIHTLNWPVVEPDRLKRALERAHRILDLSRQNWEAILAETDDQRELVPSPSQTSIVPEGRVTDEVVAAWMATLDTTEQILNGELLIPHWRFKQGFDLKAYFETATRTDLVMLLTGYDAIPYLKEGPIATAESFAEANRVFGENFLGYAFWFN
jgi:hypothetical protein